MSRLDALTRLQRWPRIRLANLPTPLVHADRLATALDCPTSDLCIKMDADTGFALGGNKVRKLEFELEASRLAGVTCLLTAGGPQSNHCRVTAAAAARLGIRCILVLNGPAPSDPTGNALLHRLFGAEIVTVEDRPERTTRMESLAEEITRGGGKPMIVPIGASTGLGCLGYAAAAGELFEDLDALGPRPERTLVFVPSSSCGTVAGLVLGAALHDRADVTFVAVSADAPEEELRADALRIAQDGADLLAWDGDLSGDRLMGCADQVGDGYGIPTPESDEATRLFGAAGFVLDPTYTAKGAAGLIDWIRQGRVRAEDRIVFLHTGGHPALLA